MIVQNSVVQIWAHFFKGMLTKIFQGNTLKTQLKLSRNILPIPDSIRHQIQGASFSSSVLIPNPPQGGRELNQKHCKQRMFLPSFLMRPEIIPMS